MQHASRAARRRVRGVSTLEYLVLLGAVAFIAAVGVRRFGDGAAGKIAQQAVCVATLSECSGNETASPRGARAAAPHGRRASKGMATAFRVQRLEVASSVVAQAVPADGPVVGPAWSWEYIRAHYQLEPAPAIEFVQTSILFPLALSIVDGFDHETVRSLAEPCAAAHSGDSWAQIACASRAVHDFLAPRYPNGQSMDNFRSFCRDHAQLFWQVFSELGIAGSGQFTISVSPFHVANRIGFVADDGTFYEYVIDSGWDPGQLMPLNQAAEDLAASTPDRQTLPEIGHPPEPLGAGVDPNRACPPMCAPTPPQSSETATPPPGNP